jgi:NNP family nitrate/nitrite transporter-like MFS transporter
MKIFLLFLFWTLWYLNFSTRTLITPLLPLIEDDFAISHALAGSLFFSFYIGHTIALFSVGFLSLRIGYKKSIIFCSLLVILSFMALRFANTYHQFVSVLFFLGIGAGLYLPCAIPLITSIFERDNWGKAISFHETATGLSILTIPLITVFALRLFHWRSLFILAGGVCFIAITFFYIFSPDSPPEKEKRVRLSVILQRKDFWIITTLWTLCGAAMMGIYNIIPLYLVKERGIQMELANSIFGLSRIGSFVSMVLMGFIIDRFKLKTILLFLALATGITTMGISIAHSFWLLVVMLLAQATFSIVFFPAGLVAVSKLTDLTERSLFSGIMMGIAGIMGPGLAPFILGAVADAWNFQIGIFMLGLLCTLSCFLFKALQEI